MVKENKFIFFTLILLMFLFIVGCQSNNLNLDDDITDIEVYEWDSDELAATINDADFIGKLVDELNNARTQSTANMDFELPDYELLFKNEGNTVINMGYYEQEMKIDGVKGNYWDADEDLLYGVKLQLPTD